MDDEELNYPIEIIPDPHSVFMRAHRNNFRDGQVGPGVFTPHGGALSVDWEKYCSARDTKLRGKVPESNAVVKLVAGDIRSLVLDVLHSPRPDNQAHSDVPLPTQDEDFTKARIDLIRIAKVVIPLGS